MHLNPSTRRWHAIALVALVAVLVVAPGRPAAAADPTFTGLPTVGVGTTPGSVAVGDLNGDGKLDFVVVNESSNNVSVRLGDGAGGFTSPATPEITVGASPKAVALGDVNGDTKLDVVTANQAADTVSIRLGDGAGGFTSPLTPEITVGSSPYSVAIADLNGDGKLDLLTANFLGISVSIRLGDGTGAFTNPATPEIGMNPRPVAIAVADLNGDAKPDFITTNQFVSGVSIRLGDGAGGFTSPATPEVTVGSNPRAVAIADLNGDAKPDLVTANAVGTVSIRIGDGAGGFTSPATPEITVDTGPRSVAVGDLNGDGKPDLVTANSSTTTVSIRIGDGAGGFTSPATPQLTAGNNPTAVAIGDLDGDAKPDLLAANSSSLSVSVWRNSTAFPPGAPTSVSATAGNASAAVTFTAPASNGGSTVAGYTVTALPGGATATGTASPITVSGLNNGTAYTFRVTATNAGGTGAASTASAGVTPAAPAPPPIVIVTTTSTSTTSTTQPTTTTTTVPAPPVTEPPPMPKVGDPGTRGGKSAELDEHTRDGDDTLTDALDDSKLDGTFTPGGSLTMSCDRDCGTPGATADVTAYSNPIALTKVKVDADGGYTATVTLPKLAEGAHHLVVTTKKAGKVVYYGNPVWIVEQPDLRRATSCTNPTSCRSYYQGTPFPGPLKRGSKGDSVTILQQTLGLPVTKTYDAATEQGVKRLQAWTHRSVTGIVDEKLWKAIFG